MKQLLPTKIYNTHPNFQYTPPISIAPSPYPVVSRSDNGVPLRNPPAGRLIVKGLLNS